jgi:hypothetical protein
MSKMMVQVFHCRIPIGPSDRKQDVPAGVHYCDHTIILASTGLTFPFTSEIILFYDLKLLRLKHSF